MKIIRTIATILFLGIILAACPVAAKITDAMQNDTVFRYSGSGGTGVDKLIGVYDAKVTKNIPLESQPHTAYLYDQLGRLERETDPLGKIIRYTYYDNGQIREKIDVSASLGKTLITYEYNNRGQITKRRVYDTTEENFTYTANGQLETAENQHIRYTYAYYPDGRRDTLTYPNGTTAYWEFDDLNRLPSTGKRLFQSFFKE